MAAHLDLSKLAKLLGYLASTHDNEVCAAARHANRLVQEAGTTWQAVLGGHSASKHTAERVIHPTRGPMAPPVGQRWADTLRWLCAQPRDPRDMVMHRTVEDLLRRLEAGRDITPDEAAWITLIYEMHTTPTAA